MRQEAMKIREHTIAEVERYHGATNRKYFIFASDRPIEATSKFYTHFVDGTPIEKAIWGIEWETQNWGITDLTIYANLLRDIVFSPFHKDLWKIENDISLAHNADSWAENITQPMTKAYIRNHYRDFKYMWEKAEAFGISCVRTGDCGMHTHISNFCFGREKKTQDEAIRKFLYIVNKHYKFMLSLFYRNPNFRDYCPRMSSLANKETAKTVNLCSFPNDHHVCVNMGHYERYKNIELRIPGGQKDYPCFRNTLESVFFLVDRCKSISWADTDSIVKIFSGCNNYVFDRLRSYVKQNGHITEAELDIIKPTVIRESLI